MGFLIKNIQHVKNFGMYVYEHLFCLVLIIAFIVGLGFVLTLFTVQNPTEVESQEILIFNISLENWGIFLTIVGLIITAFWSIYQFDKGVARKQQEKGAEIANHFAENLLLKCEIVNRVFQLSPVYNIIQTPEKDYSKLNNFDISELRYVYESDSFPQDYKEQKNKCNFDDIYYSLLESRISVKDSSNISNKELKHYDTKNARNLFVLNNANLPFHFSALIDEVLNDLEYICMNISSQAAGSTYIYQSLHQVFLRTIRNLYAEISIRNDKKCCDKFYTNIIHVYKNWTSIYKKNLARENSRRKHANQILNPKIKTV